MQVLTDSVTADRSGRVKGSLLLLLAGLVSLTACGGSSSSNSQVPLTLSGNWQFDMGEQLNSDPNQPSFTGGLEGGFLLQNSGSVTGQANFLIMTKPPSGSGGTPIVCNSGTEQISGTITGQTVSLTAQSAGAQTFTLNGTLSLDGSTIVGSYTSTDGSGCGIAVSQNWSAAFVPPLMGTVQGSFHSAGGTAGLNEQDFPVSGTLTQGPNTGASSAAVTGQLNFSGVYPCLPAVSVSGQISGNSVALQIMGASDSPVGQIGQMGPPAASGPQPVTFNSLGAGYALQSLSGIGYSVFAPACGGGSLQNPADSGNVCLGVNTTSACTTPISLTPALLTFPNQVVGSPQTTQTITLANTSGNSLGGVTISLTNSSGPGNYAETDTCGLNGLPSQGQPFLLPAKQSCTVTIGFSPQQSCGPGNSAVACLTGSLTVNSPDNSAIFTVPISGGTVSSSASEHQFDHRALHAEIE